ncbi:MAG: hypothetical protein M1309_02475 [Actinobacteria bacterium]|nr:hypothetical protein [Actinomycetota bacterium]
MTFLHWKITVAVIVIAITGGGFLSFNFLARGSGPDDYSSPPAKIKGSPYGIYSPGTLDDVPTSAGQAMLAALGMNSLAEYQDYSLSLVKDLGASWVRLDFIFNGWNYQEPSDYLNRIHREGLDVLGCIRPINGSTPTNLVKFQRETQQLVSSYPWITTWQIGNEPNLSWSNPGDFPRFFTAARKAVLTACPSCRIALAGVAALYPGQGSPTRALTVYRRIVAEIIQDTPHGEHPFDIFDLHYYGNSGDDQAILDSLDSYRELLGSLGIERVTSIWVTETATTTSQPNWPPGSPRQTEAQQAADLIERFCTMLGAGVSRVSWARPYENFSYANDPGNFYDHAGLVYNGMGQEAAAGIKPGTKKEAFYAYRTMVAETAGAVAAQQLGLGDYKFTFSDGRQPVFIIWAAAGSGVPPDLTGPVTITGIDGSKTVAEAADIKPGPLPVFVQNR